MLPKSPLYCYLFIAPPLLLPLDCPLSQNMVVLLLRSVSAQVLIELPEALISHPLFDWRVTAPPVALQSKSKCEKSPTETNTKMDLDIQFRIINQL